MVKLRTKTLKYYSVKYLLGSVRRSWFGLKMDSAAVEIDGSIMEGVST